MHILPRSFSAGSTATGAQPKKLAALQKQPWKEPDGPRETRWFESSQDQYDGYGWEGKSNNVQTDYAP